MKIKVTDYITEQLIRHNVDTVFGYQGGNISHFIDSLGNSKGISFVETYNEQAAAFAANAYAQIHETIGVAISSSGPGAINLLNGIANAFCDSIPCLFFTGDVNISAKKEDGSHRQNSFQEIDIVSIARPICKYCITISDADDVVKELDKSIQIALSDRKGPVLINLPHDIQRTIIEVDSTHDISFQEKNCENSSQLMRDALDVISNSERPLLLIGGGLKNNTSRDLLRKALLRLNVPVVTSLLGEDVLAHDDHHYRGLIGDYGNRTANLCLKYCDCIIILGSRIDDRQISPKLASFFEQKSIIHIDVDEYELGNKLKEDISINTSCDDFLKYIIQSKTFKKDYSVWLKSTNSLMEKCKQEDFPEYHHPNKFIYEVSKKISGIYTLDVGNNQMYSAQALFIRNDMKMLCSGGLGSMGYSLPGSIGACFAHPDKKIICICGDGGLQMNIQEMNTVDYYHLPVNIIVLNNRSLGMIYALQEKLFPDRYYGTQEGYHTPDFEKISIAYNFKYFKVESVDDYKHAIDMLANENQVLIDFIFDSDTRCKPDPGNGMFNQIPELDSNIIKDFELRSGYEKN